jgi:hypothetical protein
MFQRDKTLIHEVEQASGCGYEDIHPALKPCNLAVLVDTAEYDGAGQAGVPAVVFKTLFDLDGELPCGSDDQASDMFV